MESAVSLTKDIRWEIQNLGLRLASAANEEELLKRKSKRAKSREQNELELKLVIANVRKLLDQIEDAVPLINLAITTSGVNLSTNLPATVSPSRLLQASTFLTAADSLYANNPGEFVQVGPAYTLSMYMLFAGHASRPHDEESIRETTWKEVIHKARVKLVRVPLRSLYQLPGDEPPPKTNGNGYFPESFPEDDTSVGFTYQLMLVEDLDDGRVHTIEEDQPQPGPFDDILLAGIRDVVPIHQVSKIFYADTGKILNIGTEGETNNPVLLLKRDVHAELPRRMMERQESIDLDEEDELDDEDATGLQNGAPDHQADAHSDDSFDEQAELNAQFLRESTPNTPADEEAPDLPAEPPLEISEAPNAHWRLPADLDPEWVAFEVYTEEPDTDEEEECEPPSFRTQHAREASLGPELSSAFANLNLNTPSPAKSISQTTSVLAPSGPVRTSLSLLEMLIRLTALQQFKQSSHLTIEDELLNFFLEDNGTTGAGTDGEYRQRVRRDARRRVGFDPYDESPIKRRGEEYISHPRAVAEARGRESREGSYARESSYAREDRYVREGSYFDGGARYESPTYVRESIEYPRYASSGRTSSMPSSPSPPMRPGALPVKSTPSAMRPSPLRQPIATPPSSATKGRRTALRTEAERRRSSPLTREVHARSDNGSLEDSPDV